MLRYKTVGFQALEIAKFYTLQYMLRNMLRNELPLVLRFERFLKKMCK